MYMPLFFEKKNEFFIIIYRVLEDDDDLFNLKLTHRNYIEIYVYKEKAKSFTF